jgi:ABC-type phosphate transport system substrate-binding protein
MNDDFLHRIRTEPPPDFLARLKARLDLQPTPAAAAPVGSTLKKVLLGLLLSGCVFAMTLMLLNRREPEAPAPLPANSQQQTEVKATPGKQDTAPKTTETKPPQVDRVVDTGPTILAPPAYSYMTIDSLVPYLKLLLGSNPRAPAVVSAESTSDAIAQFCRPLKPNDATPLFALVTRRMTSSEVDTCAHNLGKVVESNKIHQAIVLVRSKLYGELNLTPTDIFLALSAEVPDAAQPGALIPNPNKMWSDIDSSLEREPIEFYGPESSSPAGMAFREIIFEAGCRAVTTAEHCPKLRKDGVYVVAAPSPPDMLLKLQTKPDAIGILAYGNEFLNASELMTISIQGVKPTLETINNESYPGTRSLYRYINEEAGSPPARFLVGPGLNRMQYERFAIIPPERSQP